ncbi:MAG TPA: SDR family oxidoreductase [Thermoanaerobaculia bacterium]|nr:SDR family oxidoreductase [Thermoanaerobaculia bacterium]
MERRDSGSNGATPEVVVVTGASAGVGRATVRELARRGAWVGLLARGVDGLEAARREVEQAGGRALALPVDVTDAAAVEAAAERVERELGPIDVWVNDAMVTVLAPFEDLALEDFRRVTEVNYLGTVYGTLAALRRMRRRDRGTIVQVGSALSYRAIPLQSAYCGSKFAVRGFTDALRSELLHDGSGVHLTMVHLPALNTPQFSWCKTTLPRQPQPVPPIFQPEVAAEAICFAAHARRREVWVGLAGVVIAANAVAPAALDHYLARHGYADQQSDQPLPADHRDNLYHPLPGDHGAHGRFDDRARERSVELWLSEHKGALLGAAAGAVLVAALGAALRRR